VEVTDSAQECSSDEEHLASCAKTIFTLRGARRARISRCSAARRLCGASRPPEEQRNEKNEIQQGHGGAVNIEFILPVGSALFEGCTLPRRSGSDRYIPHPLFS
jgi:hypothetical protein